MHEISPYCEENCEISMEANPGTVSLETLKDYRSLGVNRISLGVQSFDDRELKLLGRIHDSKAAIEACNNVIKAGLTILILISCMVCQNKQLKRL